jgi:hypothetical protein
MFPFDQKPRDINPSSTQIQCEVNSGLHGSEGKCGIFCQVVKGIGALNLQIKWP